MDGKWDEWGADFVYSSRRLLVLQSFAMKLVCIKFKNSSFFLSFLQFQDECYAIRSFILRITSSFTMAG